VVGGGAIAKLPDCRQIVNKEERAPGKGLTAREPRA
jgi:hypothetical protein